MRITIVGANSFIARNMLLLMKKQYPETEFFLYDYQDEQIDGSTEYHSVNVLDAASMEQVRFDVDAVYCFTGKTGTAQGFDDYNTYVDINEKAMLNLISAYRKAGSQAKIIFPSTRLVYKGKEGRLAEDAEKEFKTLYAINKYACEQYLQMYQNAYGIKYCIFRICVPYGTIIPNASSYGTAEFMLGKAQKGEDITLYGGGTVRRTLIHMEDLCNILIQGGLSEKCVDDVYNIGGEDYSLAEMAATIAEKYQIGVTSVDWPEMALKIESGSTVFDDSKLKNVLDYQYKRTFVEWMNE